MSASNTGHRHVRLADMPFEWPLGYEPAVTEPAAEPAAEPATPPEASLWFVFRRNEILMLGGKDAPVLPYAPSPEALGLAGGQRLYLGRLDGEHCYAAELAADAQPPSNGEFRGLRGLYGTLDDGRFALAGRALQLIDWDRTHKFCGACATPTVSRTTERSRECPACGLVVYPRLAPAVMCLVLRRGEHRMEMLLGRSPRFPAGTYSALAGFVEPGETLESCVAREVQEEVGVQVKNLRYFASQPWPFPHSLMIAFLAEWAGGEITPDPNEIEDAKWFDIEHLPQLPARISIARRLIDAAMGEMRAAPPW